MSEDGLEARTGDHKLTRGYWDFYWWELRIVVLEKRFRTIGHLTFIKSSIAITHKEEMFAFESSNSAFEQTLIRDDQNRSQPARS